MSNLGTLPRGCIAVATEAMLAVDPLVGRAVLLQTVVLGRMVLLTHDRCCWYEVVSLESFWGRNKLWLEDPGNSLIYTSIIILAVV